MRALGLRDGTWGLELWGFREQASMLFGLDGLVFVRVYPMI
jgi:hypothetical protein